MATKRSGKPPDGFVSQFRHHRSGKLIKASEYGHRAFPIWNREKRKPDEKPATPRRKRTRKRADVHRRRRVKPDPRQLLLWPDDNGTEGASGRA